MIKIRQIKIDVLRNQKEELNFEVKRILHTENIEKLNIVKRSIDARKKDHVYYVYEVDVLVKNEKEILNKTKNPNVLLANETKYVFPKHRKLDESPIIVGMGPAGLFSAYILAENGYKPIIIERGEPVEKRVATIEKFWEENKLNPESNVQFGEGGAGTFSDGKLNTLTKDKFGRAKKVFEIFVENGAPEEILYVNNPHIGTDVLRTVIVNIRNKIIKMGGQVFYNTKLTDLFIENNELTAIEINNEKRIPCKNLILAIGHSARDTFELLFNKKLNMEPKPFAVGIRIEHPQKIININQYGEKYADKLEPASYKLTYTTKKGRGVYSFCMCPGGYVVNASSEKNRLVTNGMSNYKRDTENANSALIVTIGPKDFGNNPLDGVNFQRNLEEKAYKIGKGYIPISLYKDYKENKVSTKLGKVNLLAKGKTTFANLNEIFPEYINESLKEGIENFGTKIKGFNRDDAILLGVEARTSSPLRIFRDENGLSNIKGIYPCGEGAGYAGGITTSAIDGIKTAELLTRV